jgi:molybdopterin converting factor small subunit
MVTIQVLLFGPLRDWFQERDIQLNLVSSEWTSSENLKLNLIKELDERFLRRNGYPVTQKLPPRTMALAVNEKILEPHIPIELNDNDVVTLIPPVSGG